MQNVTEVTVFVLKGFTDKPELQITLFFLFLAIYLFTLIGNLGLVVLVMGDPRLHNPMYYFLSVLSSVDACSSSVITPHMLVDFMSKSKVISLLGCATQMFLAVTFGTTECFLLAAMAYDRYVAIYNPLLYSVSMSPRVYVPLIIGKVFSTCGAHLTGLSIFHGTVLFMYVRPSSNYTLDHDMIVSIVYMIVIPMLNPIIYSLRNKDVKEAMKRVLRKNWLINKVSFYSKK
ncbi:olfactory receptor 141-like [Pteropus alecto]|uniref:olfactory receptor 141-like n=1 Tax=Pteropus alecto TaxID=9402 RepID=UPI0007687CD7|nr:olfactory receptor 141-like [Pteropus alecto]